MRFDSDGLKLALKKNKRIAILALTLVLGIVLCLCFSGKEKAEVGGEVSLEEYKEKMESELSELCSSIEGVGKCKVTLTFSSGAENNYKGSQLLSSKPPTVLGVAVACRGADKISVKSSLTELFTSLFDIPSNRIAILKLN